MNNYSGGNDTFYFRFCATRGCFIPEEYSPSFVFKFDFAELWGKIL